VLRAVFFNEAPTHESLLQLLLCFTCLRGALLPLHIASTRCVRFFSSARRRRCQALGVVQRCEWSVQRGQSEPRQGFSKYAAPMGITAAFVV